MKKEFQQPLKADLDKPTDQPQHELDVNEANQISSQRSLKVNFEKPQHQTDNHEIDQTVNIDLSSNDPPDMYDKTGVGHSTDALSNDTEKGKITH